MKARQVRSTAIPAAGINRKSRIESLEEALGELADRAQLAREELFEAIETATVYRLKTQQEITAWHSS